MNKCTSLFLLCVIALLIGSMASAQVPGDKRSHATGNWGTNGANWDSLAADGVTWVTPVAAPSTGSNVYIQSGHTITVEASSKNCKNLYVSGTLVSSGSVTSANYITVAGTLVQIDGTFGDLTHGLGMNVKPGGGPGGTLTIQGAGSAVITRLRPSSSTSRTTVNFNMNITMNYAGSIFYPQANDSTTFNINSPYTVTGVKGSVISNNTNGVGRPTAGGTEWINIYGTLTLPDSTASNVNLNTISSKPVRLTVYSGGTLNIGGSLNADSSGPSYLTVNNGGALNFIGTSITSSCNASNATTTIDGTLDFGTTSTIIRSLGTATVSNTGKLRFRDGFYPTGSLTLASGATIEYYGTSPVTLTTPLSAYPNLIINNSGGVTLGTGTTVNGTLTLSNGLLNTGSGTVTIAAAGSVTGAGSGRYINGNLARTFGTGGQSFTFDIGDATTYTPVALSFNNVTTGGSVTASTTAGEHPGIATSGINNTKSVNRFWTLSNAGTLFDTYAATFNFAAGDVDAGSTTSSFIVKKYDSGTWSSPTTVSPLATSIGATGMTSMSDFAVGEPGVVTYTLTVNAVNGTVTKNPDQPSYNNGTSVELTATPATGYHFTGWSGDATGTTNPLTVTMDANKSITASFAIDQFTLTPSVSGIGTITPSAPQTVNYGGSQQFTYAPGTGQHFDSLLVDGVARIDSPTSFTFSAVAANHSIQAFFSPYHYAINITAANGSVTKAPDQATYAYGTVVLLTATPAGGYAFVNWTGDVPVGHETENPLSVTVDAVKNITANFASNTRTITSSVVGGGTILPSGAVSVPMGTNQQFTFAPSTGYHLDSLLVDGAKVDSTSSYTFVNVQAAHTITAHFSINYYTLTANSGSYGTVTKSPDTAAYAYGTVVQLTAVPNTGFHFTAWTGDLTGTTNPSSITMDGNKSVTAGFIVDVVNYRSHATGNWSDLTAWEQYDGASWVNPAITAPDSTAGTIEIRSGHTVTVDGAVTADQITVDAGAILAVAATRTLRIADGADSIDCVVNGTLNQFGTVTLSGSARLSYENGATFIYSPPGGGSSMASATWRTGSTCRIDSSTGTTPTNLNTQSLYNLIINASTMGANGGPNFNDGTVIGGDLTVLNTKNLQWRIANVSGGQTKNIYIRGNVTVNGSTAVMTATGSGADTLARVNINVDGNVNVLAGTWSLGNSSAVYTEWKVKGNIAITGGTLQSGASGWYGRRTLNFVSGGPQSFSVSAPGTIGTAASTFKVSNNSVVTVNFPWTLMANGAISLQGGQFVTTATNVITVPSNGIVLGGSSTSYINGPLSLTAATTNPTSLTFPIGKGSAYRPVVLSVNQDAATSTVYTAEMFNTAPPARTLPSALAAVSGVRYYSIAKGTGANLSPTLGATIQLSYDTDDLVNNAPMLRIAKDDSAGVNWLNLGGSGTAPTTGSITSNAFFAFSNFALASGDTGTPAVVPTISTTSITSISTTFASGGGNVTNDGGAAVNDRGVCWNTTGTPTVADSKTIDGNGSGAFTSSLTSLTPGAHYYVRAYATNAAGTGYGNQVEFSTLAALIPPTVTTTAVSNIQVTTAVSGGTVTDWGGDPVTARGICWSTSADPTILNSHTSDGSGLGSYVSGMSPLTGGTTYHVRAYATNSAGTGYGADVQFTTQTPAADTTVVVAKDGSGNYTTVQAAFNAVPAGYTGHWTIFVKNGVYYEKDTLISTKINVILQGQSKDSTVITYNDYADSHGTGNPGTSGSFTLAIDASDFIAKDITIQNTYSPQPGVSGTQAVALRTQGDRHQFINCKILGYQDTYYTWGGSGAGRSYHKDCLIEGTVDFIFGRNIVVFDNCTIHEIRNGGTITAGSTDPSSSYGYVFRNCTILADSLGYDGVPNTAFYLGRPWQASPRTVFINTSEPSNLSPAGWLSWNVAPAIYGEFNCYGPGSGTSGRVAWSTQLTGSQASQYSLSNIFAKSSASSSLILYDWMPSYAATDQPLPMRITASAGTNGSISSPGTTNVAWNGSQSYTITPAIGYHVLDVLVDGVSVGAVTSYNFPAVTGNHTISATFAAQTWTLNVTAANGTVTKNPDASQYADGAIVQLTANPAAGYHFVDWSGDATGSINPLSVTMNANKNITANFAINTYTLTVNATHGTVARNPATGPYAHGTVVHLTATPAGGYSFVSWSGDLVSTGNPDSILMDGNKSVTASFAGSGLPSAFRTHQTGNWNDVNTWELYDGSTWIYPTNVIPDSVGTINVLAGHTVTVTASALVGNATIDSGGTVIVNGGGPVLSIVTGGLTVRGKLEATGTAIASPGPYAVNPTRGALTFGSGGVYQHDQTGGAIPVSTWNTGSTLLLTGIISTSPANGRQNFYNVTWNNPNQTGSLNLGWNPTTAGNDTTITIAGDINVISTGTGRWQMSAPPAGTAGARTKARINVMGNINVSGGTFTSNGTSNNYGDIFITVSGNVDVTGTGSMLALTRGSQGGTGTTQWFFRGNMHLGLGATTANSNPLGAKWVFDKAGTQTITVDSGFVWAGADNCQFGDSTGVATTVNIGNSQFGGSACAQVIKANAHVIVGPNGFIGGGTNSTSGATSSFTVENGATLTTAQQKGLLASGSSGTVQVSGARNYGTAVNYEFNGTSHQTLGGGFPATVNNFTISNTMGVTQDTAALVTVNGTLGLTGGNFYTGANVLAVSSSGTTSRTTGHVVGNFRKNVATGSAVTRTFEIGDTANYAPISVTFGNVTTAGDLQASTTGALHPQIATSGLNPLKSVNRYHTVTNSGVVFDNYVTTVDFAPADVPAAAHPAQFIMAKNDAGVWTLPTLGTKTATSIQATGLTTFSDFAVGENPFHAITASAGPHGTITPSGSIVIADGHDTTFTFTADSAYHVDSVIVNGVYVGAPAGYTFHNVQADSSIAVKFVENPPSQFTLTINAVNGSVVKNPDLQFYPYNTAVQLTPVPATGYHFTGWSDSLTGSAVPGVIVMIGNKTVTAHFALNQYPITLTVVGNGTVAKNPDLTQYDTNSVVQLTATPATGYHFVGWSGAITGTTNPTTVTMDAAKSITATFAIDVYTLAITAVNGTVELNPAGGSYDYGTTVVLSVTPATGYHFTAWSGDLISTHYPDSIVMTGNKSVTAEFAINMYPLTVTVVGTGTVTKSLEAPTYAHGTVDTLTANAPIGWLFNGWSGDATGMTNPLPVTMTSAVNITATFILDPAYQTMYRSFMPESLGVDKDNKGKAGKFVARKPVAVDFSTTLVSPGRPNTGLQLKFSMLSSGTVKNADDSIIGSWSAAKTYTLLGIDTNKSISVSGRGVSGKAMKVSYVWFHAVKPTTTKGAAIVNSILRLPMPNRVNMLYETMAGGGYGTTGLVIGQINTDIKNYGWFQTLKYGDVLKTINEKGTPQTGTPHGFDFYVSGKPVLKQNKSLPPSKFSNRLLADLIALKMSIVASAMNKAPLGFGELVYEDGTVNELNGKMVKEIAAYADSVMMGWTTDTTIKGKAAKNHHFAAPAVFANLDAVVGRIVGAFEGSVDTVKFSDTLRMTGTRALLTASFLRANTSVIPARIEPVIVSIPQEPETYTLRQNYPNPFNPTTTISFDLAQDAIVTLKIYNILGQEVATLLNRTLMSGGSTQELQFNAYGMASGVYFYRITAEELDENGAATASIFSQTKKMMLVK